MSRHTIMRLRPRRRRNELERYFVDIETWRLNARNFAFAVLKSWNGTYQEVFYSPESLREFLESRSANVMVFAHNCWKFDGLAFYSLEELMGAERLVAGNRIVSMTFLVEDADTPHTIEWRDTVALMPISISKLGDGLGLPKGETPIDYIRGNRRKITSEDVEYCIRDVEILRQGITSLETQFNEWCAVEPNTYELPLTAASMAYRVWCERYWPDHWKSRRIRRSRAKNRVGEALLDEDGNPKTSTTWGGFCDESANVAAGEAYYGGRVQVIGEPGALYSQVHSVDANSLFPAMMLKSYPDISKVRQVAPTIQNLEAILNDPDRLCWANVRLEGGERSPRFLPNTNDEGRRDWGSLEFDGWACEPEIRHALENGYELVQLRGLYCAYTIEPFSAFVRGFYQLRLDYQAENDPREFAIKIVLNSLYGRFGMRDICMRIDQPEKVGEILEAGEWVEEYELNFYDGHGGRWPYLEEIEPSKKANSNWFGFASFVTSYARVELARVIAAAGDAAIYCDTDSVHFLEEGRERVLNNITIGTALGEWKFETPPEGIPYARYWEPKAYVHFGNEMDRVTVKHKGVSVWDGEGNLRPEAGDLTKPQTTLTTVQFYTAARRGLEPGTELRGKKRSKRWCID